MKLVTVLCSLAAVSSLSAQSAQILYEPRAIKNAYARGTRSANGRPGAKYWENHGRYTIDVTALPPDRTIRGTEQIVYVNNSPDTLRRLIYKLFINIHRPGAPRNFGAPPDYLTDGITIDSYSVNGQAVPWPNPAPAFTAQALPLPAPLASHDSARLSIAWHYEISKSANREGMLDSTTYFLAYFYPRVSVYDDDNGWDTMPFTDVQEFYSDFNDYDVTIHAPANYVVWGTGTLRNANDVLQPQIAQRLERSFTSDAITPIASHAEMVGHQVTKPVQNAWHFTAANVPDMTFAISDHYDWDASSVVVDDATHRRASVQSAYNDTAADFHHMVDWGRHSLDWFSHNWPGVPYPYEKSTIVQGGADMEYPMMVNDGSNADTAFSRLVVEHEIAHTYFPFYMGINETRYGFMDEGWATTFEYLIGIPDVGLQHAIDFYKSFRVNGWINDPSPLEDLPIITPQDVLSGVAYGSNAYGKPSLGYLAVKDLLGDDVFKKCLLEYMTRWNGKHPSPWDFFYTFNNVSGRNLNWFWNAWFFSNNYIDYAVRGVDKTPAGYAVTIENVGGMPAPVDVKVTYADGGTESLHQTPALWASGARRATVRVATKKTIASVTLDGAIWMDATPKDNVWAVKR